MAFWNFEIFLNIKNHDILTYVRASSILLVVISTVTVLAGTSVSGIRRISPNPIKASGHERDSALVSILIFIKKGHLKQAFWLSNVNEFA